MGEDAACKRARLGLCCPRRLEGCPQLGQVALPMSRGRRKCERLRRATLTF